MRSLGAFIAVLAMAICSHVAWPVDASAANLPLPVGAPILTVDGLITQGNRGGAAVFDLALLQSLPALDVQTTTPWSDGKQVFRGVLLRDLLARVGATGGNVTATGIDDYAVDIPIEDSRRYDVILAYSLNGKPLPPDNKGPLWLVYPFSADAALRKDIFYARSVWQLRRLTVK
ncbi:MAG TPA: molybdopterin-dependent oxidoreductase [Dongiaceae bacterium]